jgi:hypothetical protein
MKASRLGIHSTGCMTMYDSLAREAKLQSGKPFHLESPIVDIRLSQEEIKYRPRSVNLF